MEIGWMTFINFASFVGLSFASLLIFYFGRLSNPKRQVSVSVFTLCLGLEFIALAHLFRVEIEPLAPNFIIITSLIGVIFTLTGSVSVLYSAYEISNLKRRYEELKMMITTLREKYFKQEISEEDLKAVYANILKDLTEIEVKLKGSIESFEEEKKS
ncbi:MAG: hypothetical protein QW412_02860 [Candidatus Aenigmatarchaeota archaeon]